MLKPPKIRPEDIDRVMHTELRERMISGEWDGDLVAHIAAKVSKERAKAWGEPSPLDSPLLQLAGAISTLYDQDPGVEHADTSAAERMTAICTALGAWTICAEAQLWTEALNEAAVVVGVDEEQKINLRLVSPSLLSGQSSAAAPGKPLVLRERQLRQLNGELAWVELEWSVLDPAAPVYREIGPDGAELDRKGGDAYPWRWPATADGKAGRPYIPFSMRHAQRAPRHLFNPWHRRETVVGTLNGGVLATLTDHAAIRACWPQRWGVGIQPAGGVEQNGEVDQVVADPTTVILFEQSSDKQAMVGQWETAADVGQLQDLYERRMAMLALAWGLSPSDLVRTGADPRSGASLAIQEAAIRRTQNRAAPRYRDHDERMLAMIAAEWNRLNPDDPLPVFGWRVAYRLLPLSDAEQTAARTEALELLDRGLITRAEARARVVGESVAEASRQLGPTPPSSTAPPSSTPGAQQP